MKSLPFQETLLRTSNRKVLFVLLGVLVLGVFSIMVYQWSSQDLPAALPPSSGQPGILPVEPTAMLINSLPISPTSTASISATNTPAINQAILPTLRPSATALISTPTQVVQPTTTSIPPTSIQSSPCYQVGNLEDITIPGGTEITGGQAFTKTWMFQNTGSCTWSRDTRLVLSSGDLVYSSRDFELGEEITPGMSWLLSINVIAPTDPGTYQDIWKLYTSAGQAMTNGSGEEQELSILITVLPSTTQIRGRIVNNGVPVGSGVSISLDDPFNQAIAIAETSNDGSFAFTDVPPSDQGYNVVFSRAANQQFEVDQVLSWVWVGPIPVNLAGVIELPDIDISPLGFKQLSPEPEAAFSAAAITPSSPVTFQWSAYPGGVDYWLDLVDQNEVITWQSRLLTTQAATFDGTLLDSSHIQPGEYWWAVGARRWLGAYPQIVYTYLVNISLGD